MRHSHYPYAWLALAGGIVSFLAILTWVGIEMSKGDLSRNDQIASVVSMFIALAGLPLATIATSMAIYGARHKPVAGAEQRAEFAAELASEVGGKWIAEELSRAVQDPAPINVEWENAEEVIFDHWSNITRGERSPSSEPLDLSGSFDQIYDVYRLVPSRRLAVLGEAGSGKTTLAIRFVIQAIEHRRAEGHGPVPILLPLAEWRPDRQTLEDWVVDRLVAECPTLGKRYSGVARIFKAMLREGEILSVFDGFDEVHPAERYSIISQINRMIVGPLVITSRIAEYQETVSRSDLLTSTAGVTVRDVPYDELSRFLPTTTRKLSSKSLATKWNRFLRRMIGPEQGSPEDALSKVLATPLMISLARFAYSDTNADPMDLLTAARRDAHQTPKGREHQIRQRLYSTFLAAAYSRGPALNIAKRRLVPRDPAVVTSSCSRRVS